MSQYPQTQPGPTHADYAPPSAWVGWMAFAGIMLAMLGSFHIFQGLVALLNDEYFLVGESGLVINVDFTTWGWIHLIGGLIVLAAGFGVFAGKIWARTVGVLVAVCSAVLNMAFIAAHPLWSVIMIAMCVTVILALTVHGSDIKPS